MDRCGRARSSQPGSLDDGTFRGDLTLDELGFLFGQLLQAAARMTAERVAGVEKAAALVTTVFLQGTQSRQGQL